MEEIINETAGNFIHDIIDEELTTQRRDKIRKKQDLLWE